MPEKDNYNEHEGHRERLRNRLSVTEDDDIISHEMLEAMLFFVLPRVNTNPIAHRLLDGFGSVEKVLRADKEELMRIKGVGERTAMFLVLLGKFTRAYAKSRHQNLVYDFDSDATALYLKELYRDIEQEAIYMLCLDATHRIKKECRIADGGFENVELDVGYIAGMALKSTCKYIVCVHNHPSGIAKASEVDRESTKLLSSALNFLGLKLYDSVIVTEREIHSVIQNRTVKIPEKEK